MNQTAILSLQAALLPVIPALYPTSLANNEALLVGQNLSTLTALQSALALPMLHWVLRPMTQLNDQKFDKAYPLALVWINCEDASFKAGQDHDQQILQATQSIQKCRDLYGRHCLVFVPINSNLNLTSMGFSRMTLELFQYQDALFELWQFNLFDYKQVPDWLNSRFWANPEHWDKYRW